MQGDGHDSVCEVECLLDPVAVVDVDVDVENARVNLWKYFSTVILAFEVSEVEDIWSIFGETNAPAVGNIYILYLQHLVIPLLSNWQNCWKNAYLTLTSVTSCGVKHVSAKHKNALLLFARSIFGRP